MSVFDEIDSVPWGKLHHAYGPAVDVPYLLRALMWPEKADAKLVNAAKERDSSVFETVQWELWGNVFHQGSVWQVTAATVPFLIEILRNGPDNPEYKRFLLTYLHNLAWGYPDDDFPDFPDPDVVFADVKGMEDPGTEPDYDREDILSIIWVRDSYEAVERHIDSILPYLTSADDEVAEAAIAMCATFSRCADKIRPLLREIALEGGRRGANAALSLAVLDGAVVREFAEDLAASDDLLTSVMGACAAVLADSDNVKPEVITILTQPLGELAETSSAHAINLGTLVGRCLAKLGSDHKGRAVDGICKLMVDAKGMDSLALTESLLAVAFTAPPLPTVSELSTFQLRALEAIRDHGTFETSGMTFANYALLLDGWGLPNTADGIGALLRDG